MSPSDGPDPRHGTERPSASEIDERPEPLPMPARLVPPDPTRPTSPVSPTDTTSPTGPASTADPTAPTRPTGFTGPARPAGLQPKAGPADVSIEVVLEARGGSPGAYASMVEHWDPHLRMFVHCALAGEGSTDRVLAATYVRAYRALPRYQADRTPGLWLHRVAYLAVLDELRRLKRDPLRRKDAPTTRDAVMVSPAANTGEIAAVSSADDSSATPEAVLEPRTVAPPSLITLDGDDAPPSSPSVTDLDHVSPDGSLMAEPGTGARPRAAQPQPTDRSATTMRSLRRLASDQRAMLVMIDREHFSVDQVADVFDTTPTVVRARIGIARRVLLGGHPTDIPPEGTDADPTLGQAAQAEAVAALLDALAVPAASKSFWSDLGTRLIAERDSPAAPTPDPMARLNPPHPAEPGFQPGEASRKSVTEIAGLADRTRPGRPWGRYLLVGVGVLVLVGAIAAMVRFGISERTPDGSISAERLESEVRPKLAVNAPVRVRAEVDAAGTADDGSYIVHLGENGSWAVSRSDTLDVSAYDGAAGVATKLALADGADGQPTVQAELDVGLAAGRPDPTAVEPQVLADLQAVGPLLRSDPDGRARPTRDGDVRTWTYQRTEQAGPDGPSDEWTVVVRRSDGVVLEVALHRDGELVRRTRFEGWTPNATVPDGTFLPAIPEGIAPETTNGGFTTGDLQSAQDLGRGEAITPRWLPDGFTLSTVTVRKDPADGVPSTAGGRNPADQGVLSLGYQRGPEHITVTFRDLGADPTAWDDPFRTAGDDPVDEQGRILGDGQYNGARVTINTDSAGRASLWGMGRDTLLTVSGDLSADEAYRLASSLR